VARNHSVYDGMPLGIVEIFKLRDLKSEAVRPMLVECLPKALDLLGERRGARAKSGQQSIIFEYISG